MDSGVFATNRASWAGLVGKAPFIDTFDLGLAFKQDDIYWGEDGNLFVSYCGPKRSKVWVLETAFSYGVSEWGDP
jgi:hypothetical protein